VVLAVLLLLAGAAVLSLGAGALTRGVARMLFAGGASPRVVGLSLLGVQAGPFLVVLLAAARQTPSFAVGACLGAAAYLVCGGLGAGLLLGSRPTPSPSLVTVLLPSLPLVSAALVVSDGVVTRSEGAGLLLMFAIFQFVVAVDEGLITTRGDELRRSAGRGLRIPAAVLTALGLAAAAVGAEALLWGGRAVVDHSGLAGGFVAAAMVGPLSSLAGLRSCLPSAGPNDPGGRRASAAAGQALATVSFMAAGALGVAALIHPLSADGTASFAAIGLAGVYAPIAAAFAARGRAWRAVGLVAVAIAAVWVLAAIRL
jgi:cation:H+ antiporter